MIQQINLYRNDEVGGNPLLNPYLLALLTGCGALIVASAVIWQSRANQLDHQQQLQQQLQKATAEILLLQAQSPNPQAGLLLNQELQQSESIYQSLSQVVELLSDNRSDRSRGFSHYLGALAEQSDGKVWLTRIEISATNDSIDLYGGSFRPEHIPALLQRLQQTEAFKSRRFARLDIRQSTETPEQVVFNIGSTLKKEDKREQ